MERKGHFFRGGLDLFKLGVSKGSSSLDGDLRCSKRRTGRGNKEEEEVRREGAAPCASLFSAIRAM